MSRTYKIPAYFTFVNWAIAVVLGSLFIPITSSFNSRSIISFNEEYMETVGAFAAVSAILSLPAIIILLISNIILNKQELPKTKFLLIQNGVHLGVTILTFGIIGSLLESRSDFEFVVPIALTYFIAGTIAWGISAVIFKESQTTSISDSNELIDEF